MIADWPYRDLLAHRRRTTPAATAVIDASDGAEYDYHDLDAAVERTAQMLMDVCDAVSCKNRPRVGIAAEASPRFAVALHAVWRAGGVGVPVSPTQPAADRQRRFDRLDLAIGLETGVTAFESVDPGCQVRSVGPISATDVESTSGREWSPGETALLLFTSGTTGSPKAVRLTYGNLIASAIGSAFRLGVRPDDRWYACLPPHHMGGLAPIVRATLAGTAVVLARGFDAANTPTTMAAHEATGISVVPTMVRRLLDRGWRPHDSLAVVLCGGAPTPPNLVREAIEADVPLYPTYGTTETASQIATARPSEAAAAPRTVGSPLITADVTIVDPDAERPLDTGTIGELVVDGPVVTPGYLDAASRRCEFGLKTGDLASRDADGRLEIHGRVDDAIQSGGETVHPTRVAERLRSLSEVRDAAVFGISDPEWGERVAALIEVEDGHGIDLHELRAALEGDLAPHELPGAVRTAESIPRTASGTVDRAAARSRFHSNGPDA